MKYSRIKRQHRLLAGQRTKSCSWRSEWGGREWKQVTDCKGRGEGQMLQQ